MVEHLTAKKLVIRIIVGLVLLAIVMWLCALVGAERINLRKVLAGLPGANGGNIDYDIFVRIRLPRILLAALVGAALASSGVVLQAVLRNPLAEPYILGISSGAGLGVVIAVLCGAGSRLLGSTAISLAAFGAATGTVWLVWFVARAAGRSAVIGLLLAGVVVNAFFSSIIMFLMSIAASQQLRSTTLWLMGNIADRSWPAVGLAAACIVTGIAILFAVGQKLNVLSLGDDEAAALGVNPARTRLVAVGVSAFVTAIAVSLSGLVGFVGLIVPHAVRLLAGPDHRQLLPLAAIAGAIFLAGADTIARVIIAPEQLPVGVVTALAGGPFFLVLLARYTRRTAIQ